MHQLRFGDIYVWKIIKVCHFIFLSASFVQSRYRNELGWEGTSVWTQLTVRVMGRNKADTMEAVYGVVWHLGVLRYE